VLHIYIYIYIYDISSLRVKIDIETAPTCFGVITPSSGSALFVLAKVTKHNALPDDGVITPKHVGAVSV